MFKGIKRVLLSAVMIASLVVPNVGVAFAAPTLVITGTPSMGETLKAVFTGGDGSETYQWFKKHSHNAYSQISGATASSYRIEAYQGDYTLKCVVTYTGGTVESNEILVDMPILPVEGTPMVGEVLKVSFYETSDTYDPSYPVKYQWQYNNGMGWSNVDGATASTYEVESSYYGQDIRCEISCGNYAISTTNSYYSSEVTIEDRPSVSFDITGTSQMGEMLTVEKVGGDSTSSISYKWHYNNYAEVGGATASTYEVNSPVQVGDEVFCQVMYDGREYWTERVVIAPSVIIEGKPQMGETLKAVFTGGDGTETYTWKNGMEEVQKGVESTYTINSPVKVGDSISCGVTNDFGQTYNSNYLTVEESAGEEKEPTLTLEGTPKAGETLKAVFIGGDGTETYQWKWKSGVNWMNIGGASKSSTYKIMSAYVGKTVRCDVLYKTKTYSTEEVNIESLITATLKGTPKVDETLTVEYTGGDGSETFQWEGRGLDGGFISLSGETSSTYTIGSPLEIGDKIGCTVIYQGVYYYTDYLTIEASGGGSTGGEEGDKNDDSTEDVEYATASDATQKDVLVNASQGSSFTVTIPKKITLDGKKGTADYEVVVQGDITGEEIISVIPVKSFEMVSAGKKALTATVTQAKEKFSVALDTLDNLVAGVTTTGKIAVENLTAGEWEGVFTFDIEVK